MSQSTRSETRKIVGTACCPVCSLNGHDGDSCRANLLSDGRIFCLLGGHESAPIDFRVRPYVAALVAAKVGDEPFLVKAVNRGDGYGAYHLGGDVDSIMTTIILARGQYADEKIEISYTDADLKFAQNPSLDAGDNYDRKSIDCPVPYGIDQAARTLAGNGFRFASATIGDSMRSLTFIKGSIIPGTKAKMGVRAQLTWIAG